MMTKGAIVLAIAAVAFAVNDARPATVQAYPARPITIIVPFAAGGTTDVIARILGEHMSRTLGQQFVIENYPGAGGTTASIRTMRASPAISLADSIFQTASMTRWVSGIDTTVHHTIFNSSVQADVCVSACKVIRGRELVSYQSWS